MQTSFLLRRHIFSFPRIYTYCKSEIRYTYSIFWRTIVANVQYLTCTVYCILEIQWTTNESLTTLGVLILHLTLCKSLTMKKS